MRSSALTLCFVVLTVSNVSAQQNQIDLSKLREDVANGCLSNDKTLAPIISQLWNKNGGQDLQRTSDEPNSVKLAKELAEKISYDESTQTITWAVDGFCPSDENAAQDLMKLLGFYFNNVDLDEGYYAILQKNFTVPCDTVPPPPGKFDILVPPRGLTMDATQLLQCTGFYGTKLFVYSADQCYQMAYKCYRIGLYQDSLVLLSHAISQDEQTRFYFLKGTIEMLVGDRLAAHKSAEGYIQAQARDSFGFSSGFVARVNTPSAVQFRELVEWKIQNP